MAVVQQQGLQQGGQGSTGEQTSSQGSREVRRSVSVPDMASRLGRSPRRHPDRLAQLPTLPRPASQCPHLVYVVEKKSFMDHS